MKMMAVTTVKRPSMTRYAGKRIRSRYRMDGTVNAGGRLDGRKAMQTAARKKNANDTQKSALSGTTWASQPDNTLEAISPREYAENTVVITAAIRSRGMPSERYTLIAGVLKTESCRKRIPTAVQPQ